MAELTSDEISTIELAVSEALNLISKQRLASTLPQAGGPKALVAQIGSLMVELSGTNAKVNSSKASAAGDSVDALGSLQNGDGLVSLDDSWSPQAWVSNALDLSELVTDALGLPEGARSGPNARDYLERLDSPEKIQALLMDKSLLSTLAVRLCDATR